MKVRNIITPLQGETWHIWSKHLKTINKSSKFTSLQDRAKFEEEMKVLPIMVQWSISSNNVTYVDEFS
jgi:hypothetical protein